MDDTSVSLALIGIVGAVITTLFKQLNNTTKALNANTKAHLTVAKEIKKGNLEAKERNGHLAELVMESSKQTEAIATKATKSIIDGVLNVKEQHIEKSTIDKQVINKGK